MPITDQEFLASLNEWKDSELKTNSNNADNINRAYHRISDCWSKKETSLSIDNFSLTSMPSSIWELTWLTNLSITYNSIPEIGSEINKLTELEYLHLGHNGIKSLPELKDLHKIEDLDLSHNLLESFTVPESFKGDENNCIQLLSLNNNKLTNLPKGLEYLKYLESLKLDNNNISQLPDEIPKFDFLYQLTLHCNPVYKTKGYDREVFLLFQTEKSKSMKERNDEGGYDLSDDEYPYCYYHFRGEQSNTVSVSKSEEIKSASLKPSSRNEALAIKEEKSFGHQEGGQQSPASKPFFTEAASARSSSLGRDAS